MVSSSPSAVATQTASAAFATEFGGVGHPSYEGVLEDDAVDLVYVATHHPSHMEWAVRAADAGKHVLCEKPLAVRHADAVRIVEAARRNDVFLLEAFAYRCSSADPTTGRAAPRRRDRAGASDRRLLRIRRRPCARELPLGPRPGGRKHPRCRLLHDLDGPPGRGRERRCPGPSDDRRRRRGRARTDGCGSLDRGHPHVRGGRARAGGMLDPGEPRPIRPGHRIRRVGSSCRPPGSPVASMGMPASSCNGRAPSRRRSRFRRMRACTRSRPTP